MKLNSVVLAALPLVLSVPASAQLAPVIDASFDDWDTIPVVAIDAAGDAIGAFDVTELRAVGMGSELYLRFDTNTERNLVSGRFTDGDWIITIGLPGTDLVIDYRERSARRDGGVSWNDIRFVTLPTYASDEFEVRVDLGAFGIGQGDTVSVQFSGSDSLTAPASVIMGSPAAAPVSTQLEKPVGADLRVASLNTLSTGLFSASRGDELARLIDAVDADIYCFQEEYSSNAPLIRGLLEGIDPLDNGLPWNVVHNGSDEVIASQYPLDVVTSGTSAAAGGLVRLSDTEGLLVFSVHHKCCGNILSSEDATRIGQSNAIADTIADFRAAALGGSLSPFADAGIVVIGDWNLVGSREPLDVLLDPRTPDMVLSTPINAGGNDAATWRDLDGFGFPPGVLDLITFSGDRLTELNSYALDTELLTSAELASLGLEQSDSTIASDHKLLVLDLALGAGMVACPADLTTTGATLPAQAGYGQPDGTADLDDLGFFIANWLANDVIADLTTSGATLAGQQGFGASDGVIDLDDLGYFLGVWLAGCP
ncbi:MAG: GC-type dockerin domain-anchored protein [Planctomycetota bacterium]